MSLSLALFDPARLFGLPAHPLLVHVPIVLVPLAGLLALAGALRPRWRVWCLPLTAVLAGASLVGVQLAMGSGEELERGRGSALLDRHAQLAEQARPLVALFVAAAMAAAVVAWYGARPTPRPDGPGAAVRSHPSWMARLVVPLCLVSVATGALATTWIVKTGHAGAQTVWQDDGPADRDARAEDG